MKRIAVSASALIFVFLACMASSYAADQIKLKYSNYFPPTHRDCVLTGQFCEEIKKRTGGRVEITHYPGGTLLTGPKMFQGVVTGISDLGTAPLAYNQGRFPVLDAADLPLGRSSAWVATHVADDFYRKFTPKEFDNVHVLFLYAAGPNIIYTTKVQVKTLEDLKGLKLRGTGKIADTLAALGASVVPLDMVDVYEAMRRGVIEGVMGPLEMLYGFKTGEIAKWVTASWKVGSTYSFYAAMNKDKWNSLPADIKKIFDEVSKEFTEKHAVGWNDIDLEGAEFFKKHGGQFIQLSDAELKKWEKAVEPLIDSYKKDMLSKGFKSDEIDEWFRYLRERIVFWENKVKETSVKMPFQ